MKDRIKELLGRVPFTAVAVLYVGYLGWDLYNFMTAEDSPLKQKEARIVSIKQQNVELAKKVQEAKEFLASLERKKIELRALAQQLEGMTPMMGEQIDVPSFMNLVIDEAGRVGLVVQELTPVTVKKQEYYEEQPFKLKFRAVFAQFLVFLQRLSVVDRLVRIDEFDLRQVGSNLSSLVGLEGELTIKTYRYKPSKADEIAAKSNSEAPLQPVPQTSGAVLQPMAPQPGTPVQAVAPQNTLPPQNTPQAVASARTAPRVSPQLPVTQPSQKAPAMGGVR